jgi:hypothetical protein
VVAKSKLKNASHLNGRKYSARSLVTSWVLAWLFEGRKLLWTIFSGGCLSISVWQGRGVLPRSRLTLRGLCMTGGPADLLLYHDANPGSGHICNRQGHFLPESADRQSHRCAVMTGTSGLS